MIINIFKNELIRSYNENKRLQKNINIIKENRLFNKVKDTIKQIKDKSLDLITDKSLDLIKDKSLDLITNNLCKNNLLKNKLETIEYLIYKINNFITSEISIPIINFNFNVPQYYGGINNILELKKLGKKIKKEEFICYIENNFIPFVFTNIEKDEIKKILGEEIFLKIQNFIDEIKKEENNSEYLKRIKCIDIRNIESRIVEDNLSKELITKFQCKFFVSFFKIGYKNLISKIKNFNIAIKSNCMIGNEYPEISDFQYSPLNYS